MSTASLPARRTVVGRITAVYGVKGWVKIHSYTEPEENLFDYRPWYLTDPNGKEQQIVIDDYHLHGKGFTAHIKGVDDRNLAALYCQRDIRVDLGELPELPEGEYYWQQLTGLQVLSSYKGQAPLLLGEVSGLLETGANDVLVVAPCENSIDQRERLLPYVDAYVLKVDLDAGALLVDWDPDF